MENATESITQEHFRSISIRESVKVPSDTVALERRSPFTSLMFTVLSGRCAPFIVLMFMVHLFDVYRVRFIGGDVHRAYGLMFTVHHV